MPLIHGGAPRPKGKQCSHARKPPRTDASCEHPVQQPPQRGRAAAEARLRAHAGGGQRVGAAEARQRLDLQPASGVVLERHGVAPEGEALRRAAAAAGGVQKSRLRRSVRNTGSRRLGRQPTVVGEPRDDAHHGAELRPPAAGEPVASALRRPPDPPQARVLGGVDRALAARRAAARRGPCASGAGPAGPCARAARTLRAATRRDSSASCGRGASRPARPAGAEVCGRPPARAELPAAATADRHREHGEQARRGGDGPMTR